MANKRTINALNQMRVDVPHIRSLESAVRNDFDELLSLLVTGNDKSYVLGGFKIDMATAVGNPASQLSLAVANSAILHGNSDIAGTFYKVDSAVPNQILNPTTNSLVEGSFTPDSDNYIGLEFVREPDNSTIGQLYFWNPTNKTEFSKNAPLAQTLYYKIVITSSIWASNVLPVALVRTDGSNVEYVEDRRPMLFRLGTAGASTPDPFSNYPWPEGRLENFWRSTTTDSPFAGGDKQLVNLKDWMDAVMSTLKEVKGTAYWYSQNSGGSLVKLRGDIAHLQMTGAGKFYHAESTAGQMNWDSDIYLNFIGSRLSYKINSYYPGSDLTLSNNEVAYVKLVRGVDIAPNLIFTSGSATVTSVGNVDWTDDVLAGDYIKIAYEDDTRYFQIATVVDLVEVTLTEVFDGVSTGSGGVQAKYAWGNYEVNSSPSTDRHLKIVDRKDVPFDEDVYWLFFRKDDGSSVARIYLRGSAGGELEQGEERGISDNTSLDILEYIGSASEVDNDPDYLNAITTSLAEETTITFPAGAALTSGEYFTINSALDLKQFYIDVVVDSISNDPQPPDLTRASVNVSSGFTNLQVAAAYKVVIESLGYFNVVDNFNGSITVTNSQQGICTAYANVDMPSPFAISQDVAGTGSFNRVVVDDDNLTKTIKRLDEAVGALQDASDLDNYEEIIEVISGAPSTDNEITGPVAANTLVKIPTNSRNFDVQESYGVGEGELEIFLNGDKLVVNKDYLESSVTEIEFTFILTVGDRLEFQKVQKIGGGSGGFSTGVNLGSASDADVFKQNVGDQMQFRRLTAGSNINLTQNANDVVISSSAGVSNSTVQHISGINHNLLINTDVLLVSNGGVDVTVTLPSAASANGKIFYIKKIDAGNIMHIATILNQTIDGIDRTAVPFDINIQYEIITLVSDGSNWFVL